MSTARLPSRIDLSNEMPPVGDQGDQWSCCAWALCYAIQSSLLAKTKGWKFIEHGHIRYDRIFSPAFVFNSIKSTSVLPHCNHGINFDEVINFVRKSGAAFWKDFPYNGGDCATLPEEQVNEKALQNKLPPAIGLDAYNARNFKEQLAKGNLLFCALPIENHFREEGFEAFKNKKKFTYIPQKSAPVPEIHCMVCTGFDDASETFTFMNSYGHSWGNAGYVDIPYKHIPELITEAYAFANQQG